MTRTRRSGAAGRVLLRLAGTGHPDISARHGKTLEFSPAASITARATCVVAVAAQLTDAAPGVLAGPVTITVRAGEHDVDLAAVANPQWRPGQAAVVRRSSNRLPGTLATDADLAAVDLPREFVALLADPATPVEVTLRARDRHPDGRAGLVLLWACGAADDPRLVAELAAADLVITEDTAARTLVAAGADAGDLDLVDEVGSGTVGRVLVVSTVDLPGGTVTELLARPDLVRVETAGLPPALAAAAASPRRGQLHWAGRLQRRLPTPLPAGTQLVFAVAGEHLADILSRAGDGRTGVLLSGDGTDPWAVWGPLTAGRRGTDLVCCLDGRDQPTADGLDDVLTTLVRRLAADGVPTKTLAGALAAALGWPRSQAYDAVTRLREPC